MGREFYNATQGNLMVSYGTSTQQKIFIWDLYHCCAVKWIPKELLGPVFLNISKSEIHWFWFCENNQNQRIFDTSYFRPLKNLQFSWKNQWFSRRLFDIFVILWEPWLYTRIKSFISENHGYESQETLW